MPSSIVRPGRRRLTLRPPEADGTLGAPCIWHTCKPPDKSDFKSALFDRQGTNLQRKSLPARSFQGNLRHQDFIYDPFLRCRERCAVPTSFYLEMLTKASASTATRGWVSAARSQLLRRRARVPAAQRRSRGNPSEDSSSVGPTTGCWKTATRLFIAPGSVPLPRRRYVGRAVQARQVTALRYVRLYELSEQLSRKKLAR